MKRFFVMGKQIMLAAVLFAGLSLTSCDKDENEPEQPNNEQPTPTPNPDPDPTPTPNPDPDPTPTPDPTPAGKTVELDAASPVLNYNQAEFGYVLPEIETRTYTKVTIVLEANEGETIVRDNFGMVFKTNNNPHWQSEVTDRQLDIEYNEATKTVVITPKDGELQEGEKFSAFRFYPKDAATTPINFTAKSVVAEYEGGEAEPEPEPTPDPEPTPEPEPVVANPQSITYSGQWASWNFPIPEGATAIDFEFDAAPTGVQFCVSSDCTFTEFHSWDNTYGSSALCEYQEIKSDKESVDLVAMTDKLKKGAADKKTAQEGDTDEKTTFDTDFSKITTVNVQCTVTKDFPTVSMKAIVTLADGSKEAVSGVSCGWNVTENKAE